MVFSLPAGDFCTVFTGFVVPCKSILRQVVSAGMYSKARTHFYVRSRSKNSLVDSLLYVNLPLSAIADTALSPLTSMHSLRPRPSPIPNDEA